MSSRGDGRDGGERRPGAYSPGRRTALVLCGTGAHGAYHAGALRAIQEAGVKIDLVAGHGVGAGAAALAAIDGGPRLWEPDGLWRAAAAERFYPWNAFLRGAGWLALLLLLLLLAPVLVLAAGLLIYPAGFLLTLVGLDAGPAIVGGYSDWVARAFAPERMPTIVPRLAMVVLAAIGLLGLVAAAVARWRSHAGRRSVGAWWWQVAGAPLDAAGVRLAFIDAIWHVIRGAAVLERPTPALVGRRYAEVLGENIGQPGFRELILAATDLDARRDVIVALLKDPYARSFLAPVEGRDRRAEVLDLTGAGRDHAIDVLAGALTPPVACDPALVTFAIESFWRGETHRVCDRPAAVIRLLDEVVAAGVTQVIVVSASASPGGPHRLSAPRLGPRNRLGEFLAAAECAALHDALEAARGRFEATYLVAPVHNPLGPFDFRGRYDEASDRRQTLLELMDAGYNDAYRQFIEPVVGASGEQLVHPGTGDRRLGY